MKSKIYSCSCGCSSSISFSTVDNMLFIDFLSSDFYSRQGYFRNILHSLRLLALTILNDHNICIKEILVNREDLINIKKYLNSLTLDNKSKNEVPNCSKLKLSYSKDFGFTIKLISQLSLKDILMNKSHRAYEIAFGNEERNLFVRKINEILVLEKMISLK